MPAEYRFGEGREFGSNVELIAESPNLPLASHKGPLEREQSMIMRELTSEEIAKEMASRRKFLAKLKRGVKTGKIPESTLMAWRKLYMLNGRLIKVKFAGFDTNSKRW